MIIYAMILCRLPHALERIGTHIPHPKKRGIGGAVCEGGDILDISVRWSSLVGVDEYYTLVWQ